MKKPWMKFAFLMIFIAGGLLAYAATLPPYKVGSQWQDNVPNKDSRAYHQARSDALTQKFRLEDYGVTLLAFSSLLAGWACMRRVPAPSSYFGIGCLAIFASVATVAGSAFDLLQAASREEFPPWADSLGIPMMAMPPLLLVLLVWSVGHLTFLRGHSRRVRNSITYRAIRFGPIWLRIVSVITAGLVFFLAFEGAYWIAIPGMIWLYFYASLAAVQFPDSNASGTDPRAVPIMKY